VGGEAVPHLRGSVTGQPRRARGDRVGLAVVAVGLRDVPHGDGPVHQPPAVVVVLLGAALGGVDVGVAAGHRGQDPQRALTGAYVAVSLVPFAVTGDLGRVRAL
jgi:hypothetical protein